jgi:hypothetical protein
MGVILNFISEWVSELIAGLIGATVIWILSLLPHKYQYPKRLNFALKVSKAVSKAEVSIELREPLHLKDLEKIMKKFLEQEKIKDVDIKKFISFNSSYSGSSYKIKSSIIDEGNDLKKYFINIDCHNAFNIGLFGNIKNLSTTMDELQEVVNYFDSLKRGTEKITTYITITPRERFNFDSKIQAEYSGTKFSTIYDMKNIKLTNEGFAYIKENINKVFYEWIASLL